MFIGKPCKLYSRKSKNQRISGNLSDLSAFKIYSKGMSMKCNGPPHREGQY